MKFRIHPLDTLFFRDGKPFSMGEDTWADGIFPPYPSVIYGGLRTWYLSNQNEGFSQQTIELSKGISIRHIHYQVEQGVYLPLPLDMVEPAKTPKEEYAEARKKVYKVIKLGLDANPLPVSSFPLPKLLLPSTGSRVEALEDGLISLTDFQNYLQGYLQETEVKKIRDYALTEPKIGIGRDNATHTVENAKLYRVGMRRIENFNILVDFAMPDFDPGINSSLLRLGAEGKVVAFESSSANMGIAQHSIELSPGAFKLYLSTPAIFNEGWQPNLKKYGIKAELVAAVVGKPLHIGGFDMVKRKPKTMYKAVPAGSVYYYETTDSPEYILEQVQQGQAISDQLSTEGFGIAYLGNY